MSGRKLWICIVVMNFCYLVFKLASWAIVKSGVKKISKQTHVSVEKRRKKVAAKSRVILILHLID